MSLSRTSSPQQSRSTKHRSQPSLSQPVHPPDARMSPASRYHSNLKVLRRREPSIISIFDQFSHVCVYHHNGQKWEKHGFEGTMFLYERDSYPPYGFYILNRMGMEDYDQPLYPEDDVTAHGHYLMLRSYPNFTAARLAAIRNNSTSVPGKFSNVYAYNPSTHSTPNKSESQTIGLWTFSTDGRGPLNDAMLRLHSYVKRNLPYPEEYRYGPDRPLPLNPSPHSSFNGDSDYSDAPGSQSDHPNEMSDVDKLFVKFLTNTQAAAPSTTPQVPPTSQASTSTSLMSVQSPRRTPGSSELARPAPLQGALATQQPTYQRPQSTGISLLDTIFASAGNNPLATTQAPSFPPQHHPQSLAPPQNTIHIHSPTPRTSALPPQVLSQNVIGSLLGLPPSPTPSAASTASSASPSHPSSRDGDNEDESHGSSSDGSTGQPLNVDPAFRMLNVPTNGQGPSVNGDSTPRPSFVNCLQKVPDGQTASSKPRNGRPLVPFESNSELWPYPRKPLEDETDELEEGEILELDFSDMSALSDPDAFLRAQQQKGKKGNGSSTVNGPKKEKEKEKGKKSRRKGKKETPEAIARERAEIEKSWDFPHVVAPNQNSSPATPSPQLSPPPTVVAVSPPNGRSHQSPASAKVKNGKNGKNEVQGDVAGRVQADRVSDSLLASLTHQPPAQRPSVSEKKAFVKELMALIETDSAFVDNLWQNYHAHSA